VGEIQFWPETLAQATTTCLKAQRGFLIVQPVARLELKNRNFEGLRECGCRPRWPLTM
jgi:hypothetical protein